MKNYGGLGACYPLRPTVSTGLDKLRASEPCESREASVKKKRNPSKNCKFTDEELSTYYTD